MEGHVLSLFEGFRRLPVTPTEIRLTGGLSRSGAWRQAMADIFQSRVVPVLGEGAALGAAIHAAWVWHREEDRERPLEELSELFVILDEGARRSPSKEHKEIYDLLRRLFRSLSRRVRGLEGEDPFALRREILALPPRVDG